MFLHEDESLDLTSQRFRKLSSVVQYRELQAQGVFVNPGIPQNRLVVDTTALAARDAANVIAGKLGIKLPD